MAQIITKISLEVSKPNLIQAIVAKQYDSNSRFLKVALLHNGEKIEVPVSSTVTINALRKDGGKKSFKGAVNDDNTVTVPLTYWMLELDGTVNCDISVIDEDKRLTTTSFTLEVQRAANGGDEISTDENYDVLVKLIEDVKKVTPDQTYSPESTNAQSGVAVAEAVKKAGIRKIRRIELGTGETANTLKITTDEDGNPFELNEAFFTAHLIFNASGTTSNLRVRADGGERYIVLKTGLSLANGIITCGGTINAHGGILTTSAVYSTTDNPQSADYVYGMIAKTANITHNLKDIEVLIYNSAFTELKEGSFLELWGC